MRGGNLCGAAWQRLQLARNLFSPSARTVPASSLLRSAETLLLEFAAGSALEFEFAFLGGSAANTAETNARVANKIVILSFIVLLSAPGAGQSDRRRPWSKRSSCGCPTSGRNWRWP